MATFKNVKTGNIVKTDNKITIDLMSNSENYVPYVPATKTKPVVKDKKNGKR